MCGGQGIRFIIFLIAGFIFTLPIDADCALRVKPELTLRGEYTDNFDLKEEEGFITYLYPKINLQLLGKTHLEFGYTLRYSYYSIGERYDDISHLITCLANRELTRRLSIDVGSTLFEPVEPVTIGEYGIFEGEERYYTSNRANLVLRYLVARNIIGYLRYHYGARDYKDTTLSDSEKEEIGLDLAGRLSPATTINLEYVYEGREHLRPLNLLSTSHTIGLRLEHLLGYQLKTIFNIGYEHRKDEGEPSIEDELYGVTLIYRRTRRDTGTIDYTFRLMSDYEGSAYRNQRIRLRIERLITRTSSLSVGTYYGYVSYVRVRRNDKLWGLGIMIRWQLHEDILFNLRYGWGKRDSNEYGKDYIVNRGGIEIKYTFW